MVPMMMLIKKFPGTFFKNKNRVMIRLIIEAMTIGEDRLPRPTKLCGFPTTIPPFCRPIKAINNPIPTVIASFKEVGIDLEIITDNLLKATIANRTPERTTAPKASI